jgi:hypothetical protein
MAALSMFRARGCRRAPVFQFLQPVLGPHPASTAVEIVVLVLGFRFALRFWRQRQGQPEPIRRTSIVHCFLAGVLLVNALAHFTHGISGEDFAAPFRYALGAGIWSNLANVLWGFLNLVLGYQLVTTGKVFGTDQTRTVAFFTGILVMGLFLSSAFSR